MPEVVVHKLGNGATNDIVNILCLLLFMFTSCWEYFFRNFLIDRIYRLGFIQSDRLHIRVAVRNRMSAV